METYDGRGWGETLKFKDVFRASLDEVQDFLEDVRAFNGSEKAPPHKEELPSWMSRDGDTLNISDKD